MRVFARGNKLSITILFQTAFLTLKSFNDGAVSILFIEDNFEKSSMHNPDKEKLLLIFHNEDMR